MKSLAALLPRHIAAQLVALMFVAVILIDATIASAFFVADREMRPPEFDRPTPCLMVPHQPGGPDAPVPPDIIAKYKDIVSLCDRRPHGPPIGGALIPTVVIFTISIALLGLWATRELVRPLNRIAASVGRYQAGETITPLAEEGPDEIRTLSRALNDMRDRISALLSERTRMLAAISHDLRTPITRLRLRAEFMPNPIEQRRMLADLEHMEALVNGALTHLSDGHTVENRAVINVSSLLETVADQFVDLGCDVTYHGPDALTARVDPHDLQRAVTNLVENATRYGKNPVITISRGAMDELEVRVEDEGPGIPAHRREAMLQPFARGDEARNMNDFEGFGLGLSIARVIAEAHGGRLDLRDREPHGLAAVIALPAKVVVFWGTSQGPV
jgi:signal transduction histidine kinase